MIMYNTVLHTPDNNGWGSLSFTFKANTIVTLEIITKFIQEFYDRVLFLTNSTLKLVIQVKLFDGCIKNLTPIQVVNQEVPLLVLVDIINCFWANRTSLLDGTVFGIVIRFKDSGSTPICLCPPTPDRPTMILSKHNRVTPNPIFPCEDTINYLENLHVSTTLSSMDSTPSTDSTSSSKKDSLPRIIEFTNLDQTKELKAAKEDLSGIAGVYAIICNVTGAMYIGSSIHIGNRRVNHLVSNNTNEHLKNSINHYGLENFVFVVVEFFKVDPELSLESNKANLLALEQKHLDWLFSLP